MPLPGEPGGRGITIALWQGWRSTATEGEERDLGSGGPAGPRARGGGCPCRATLCPSLQQRFSRAPMLAQGHQMEQEPKSVVFRLSPIKLPQADGGICTEQQLLASPTSLSSPGILLQER